MEQKTEHDSSADNEQDSKVDTNHQYQHPSQMDKQSTDINDMVMMNLDTTLPMTLQQCSVSHLISLITNNPSLNDETINPFKDQIIQYLQYNHIDGSILFDLDQHKFSNLVFEYSQNDDIQLAANVLYKKLTELQFTSINV